MQAGIRVHLQHQSQLVGPVVLAKQQARHLGLGDGPHQKAQQGLLGGRLPADEGERLPGGAQLDETGYCAELVVVFVGLHPQQIAVGLHLGELGTELGQLVLAPKARHGANQPALAHQRQPVDDERLAVEHYLLVKLGALLLQDGEHAAARQQLTDGLADGGLRGPLIEAQQPDAVGIEGGEPALLVYGEYPLAHGAQGAVELRIEAPYLLGLKPQQGPLVALGQPGCGGAVEQHDEQGHGETEAQEALQVSLYVPHQITDRDHTDDPAHLIPDGPLAAHRDPEGALGARDVELPLQSAPGIIPHHGFAYPVRIGVHQAARLAITDDDVAGADLGADPLHQHVEPRGIGPLHPGDDAGLSGHQPGHVEGLIPHLPVALLGDVVVAGPAQQHQLQQADQAEHEQDASLQPQLHASLSPRNRSSSRLPSRRALCTCTEVGLVGSS